MCFFLPPAELGKAEGVCGAQAAALEHAEQWSMSYSACFLQLHLSALTNDSLTCTVRACIHKMALSQAPCQAAHAQELHQEFHSGPL